MKKNALVNESAEKAALGSVYLEPRYLDDMPTDLRPECFSNDILGSLYGTLQEMRATSQPIDPVTVFTEFSKRETITGGIVELLEEVSKAVPVSYNAAYYGRLVLDCWRRRIAQAAAMKMLHAVKDPSNNLDEALGACESEFRLIEEACLPKSQLAISDILIECMDEKNRCEPGTETGFAKLDEKITGMQPGQLIIVAARTTVGKSAFAANIATNLCERREGVFIVTLEMSKADFIYRMVARISGLWLSQIKGKDRDTKHHPAILDAMGAMDRWPMFLDDTVPQTVAQIGAKARSLVRKHGIKLMVVDYLQLVQPADRRAPREQQIAGISRELKLLAKQLRIPIIALSQLNRQVENRNNKMPQLSDIRESGAVEQDADGIWLIHRPGFSDATKADTEAHVIVAKNRQGPTGNIELEWIGERFLFREKMVW